MLFTSIAVLLLGAATHVAGIVAPLRVLRVSPSLSASPVTSIAVTFDRPVAGSLDRTVDPSSILRIEPAISGRAEWRDPITLVFTPSAPLRGNSRVTVTVSTSFRAMDGTRLAEPYRFSFRVSGPRLLAGSPVSTDEHPRYLKPDARFYLVYSQAVDLLRLSAAATVRFDGACSGERVIPLRATGQRRMTRADNGYRYRSSNSATSNGAAVGPDSLRRIVSLAPTTPLPKGCTGDLVAPLELGDASTATSRWRFQTYGTFRLADAMCAEKVFCPSGPARLVFSTPVRGAEVMRRVKILPATPFTVGDTASESDTWTLEAKLKPRVTYAVVVDTAMRDVFVQALRGNPAGAVRTTGYEPSIEYPYGRLLVERAAFGTLAVSHVNVDTLVATIAAVPDSLEARFLGSSEWSWKALWAAIAPRATVRRIAVPIGQDQLVTTGLKMPVTAGQRAPLLAVRVTSTRRDTIADGNPQIALVQVTDLGVHAKIGAESGVVWVTGVSDGKPRAGATVTLHDAKRAVLATATSDAQGLASLAFRADTSSSGVDEEGEALDGFVSVTLGADRAVVGIRRYDPDLSPWRFNVSAASDEERALAAGAVFTERGIYRPGERVYAKAIVRHGALGTLAAPARGDSVRWIFHDRDDATVKDTTVALSSFGTADYALAIAASATVGSYDLAIQGKRAGKWLDLAHASYRVAEYRPPEFLVDLSADERVRFPGDSLRTVVQARYLFGAPMGRAAFTWQARQTPASIGSLDIPNSQGFFIGESGWWWEEDASRGPSTEVFASGRDTLDAAGQRALSIALRAPAKGRAARVTVSATVTDVNRQTVSTSTTTLVHPASYYIGAKPLGTDYFWTAGRAQSIGVIALKPTGERVTGRVVRGTVTRREWHQVHRERNGIAETVGEWVTDTVARCTVTTAAEPVPCSVTPAAGGTYVVTFRSSDERGRAVSTSLYRWATGKDWIPWNDETRFKMDVIPDRTNYSVGDTASVLFASPFTDAEAWITVEREGVIEQRRMRLASGSTTLKFPITEAYVPNAFVSIFVARGRSAPPGKLDDPGRPTIRVGYAELRVTPAVKRLTVTLDAGAKEYRPGDTARVGIHVADARGAGQRAEVTLWAVDEGVLALTGYTTPDPISLIYAPRGLGLRLASNMASVAPQIPEGEKGRREPGGGGGANGGDILRSRFQTTAFFLGSVVTDASGRATASAKLPDNLTTFRVMAVAVTSTDRFGSAQTPMLVTRALVARPALPRFVRAGDDFSAGTVVNQRAGGTPTVQVSATATGAQLRGDASQTATLEAGRGREVRFPFRAIPGDSATFRFRATSGAGADAVESRLAIKPDFAPRSYTIAGVLHDTATATFVLPAGIDPARSRVTLSLGSSPLALIRGAYGDLRVYPYYCTEQVTSAGAPLIALYRAGRTLGDSVIARADLRRQIESAVDIVSRRQRTDGGIGYWSVSDWTSPWLSAYAGALLLDARAVGVPVDDSVLARLGAYLSREAHSTGAVQSPVATWYARRSVALADRVAAVDYLSRVGTPDVGVENQLLALAPQLAWEDRVRLGEVLARRSSKQAALGLLAPAWAAVKLEGRRATLPDSVRAYHYFTSSLRPVARLLTATLAVSPDHPLIGPLVETLVQGGRAERAREWNTQDQGSLVTALADFEARRRAAGMRAVRVHAGGRTLLETGARAASDSSAALTGLLTNRVDGDRSLALSLSATGAGDGAAYYYLTVREIPLVRPVTPGDAGIQVERWYERYDAKTPIVSAGEGELVRVRLRITVPADRQFVVLDDALPAGLEAVDLSLRTSATLPGPGKQEGEGQEPDQETPAPLGRWYYGSWDSGWWSPFDHREIRDDRVVYFATLLWKGTYTATYVARATTPGVFVRPPAHAEEMYNPGVNGRSDGGVFTVTAKKP